MKNNKDLFAKLERCASLYGCPIIHGEPMKRRHIQGIIPWHYNFWGIWYEDNRVGTYER